MPKTSLDRLDFYLSGPTVRHISICLLNLHQVSGTGSYEHLVFAPHEFCLIYFVYLGEQPFPVTTILPVFVIDVVM